MSFSMKFQCQFFFYFYIIHIFKIFKTSDVYTHMFHDNLFLIRSRLSTFFFVTIFVFILFYIIFIFMTTIENDFSKIKKVFKCSENMSILILLKRNAMRIYTFFFLNLFKKHIFNCSIILSQYFALILNFKIIF